MALILREADVRAVLTMGDTMRVLEAAFRRAAAGEARNQPRRRVALPEGRGVLHVLPAYTPGTPGHPEEDGPGLVGLKSYAAVGGKVRFLVQLFSGDDGRPRPGVHLCPRRPDSPAASQCDRLVGVARHVRVPHGRL